MIIRSSYDLQAAFENFRQWEVNGTSLWAMNCERWKVPCKSCCMNGSLFEVLNRLQDSVASFLERSCVIASTREQWHECFLVGWNMRSSMTGSFEVLNRLQDSVASFLELSCVIASTQERWHECFLVGWNMRSEFVWSFEKTGKRTRQGVWHTSCVKASTQKMWREWFFAWWITDMWVVCQNWEQVWVLFQAVGSGAVLHCINPRWELGWKNWLSFEFHCYSIVLANHR